MRQLEVCESHLLVCEGLTDASHSNQTSAAVEALCRMRPSIVSACLALLTLLGPLTAAIEVPVSPDAG